MLHNLLYECQNNLLKTQNISSLTILFFFIYLIFSFLYVFVDIFRGKFAVAAAAAAAYNALRMLPGCYVSLIKIHFDGFIFCGPWQDVADDGVTIFIVKCLNILVLIFIRFCFVWQSLDVSGCMNRGLC